MEFKTGISKGVSVFLSLKWWNVLNPQSTILQMLAYLWLATEFLQVTNKQALRIVDCGFETFHHFKVPFQSTDA